MNVYDAIRTATDPYGMNGDQVSANPPSAEETIERLRTLGFEIVDTDASDCPRPLLEGRGRDKDRDTHYRTPRCRPCAGIPEHCDVHGGWFTPEQEHDVIAHHGNLPTIERPGPLVAGCTACNSPEAIERRRAMNG